MRRSFREVQRDGFAASGKAGRSGEKLSDGAVWCSSPLEVEKSGFYKGALRRAMDDRMGWCVGLRLPGEDAADFAARLAGVAPRIRGRSVVGPHP